MLYMIFVDKNIRTIGIMFLWSEPLSVFLYLDVNKRHFKVLVIWLYDRCLLRACC